MRQSLCVASLLAGTLISQPGAADTLSTSTAAAPAVVVHYSAANSATCARVAFDNQPYAVNGTTFNFGDSSNSYYIGTIVSNNGTISGTTASGDFVSVPDSSLFGYSSLADLQSVVHSIHYVSRSMTLSPGTVSTALAAALPGWTYAFDGWITYTETLLATNLPGCPLGGVVDVYIGQAGYNVFPPQVTNTGTNVTVSSNVSAFSPLTGTTVTALVDVTFAAVTGSGTTLLTATSYVPGTLASNFSLSSGGYQAEFYDVSTTAAVTGPITVCQHYNDADNDGIVDGTSVSETNLRILHGEGNPVVFVDRTSSLDTTNNIICGQVSSLSPFVVAVTDTAIPALSGWGLLTFSGLALGFIVWQTRRRRRQFGAA